MFAEFYEIPSLPFQDIEKPKRRGWTNGQMDVKTVHSNDPKFSNRYAWANSADPDQTAPRGGAV